jgi:hypothetical protein
MRTFEAGDSLHNFLGGRGQQIPPTPRPVPSGNSVRSVGMTKSYDVFGVNGEGKRERKKTGLTVYGK